MVILSSATTAARLADKLPGWRERFDLCSVPQLDDGLPVGLQIIAPRLAEALILRASAAFEAIAPWADKRPPLP